MAIWPWYGNVVLNNIYNAAEFLQVESYQHVVRWAKLIQQRPAVQRGIVVNRVWGEGVPHLAERHSAEDLDRLLNI